MEAQLDSKLRILLAASAPLCFPASTGAGITGRAFIENLFGSDYSMVLALIVAWPFLCFAMLSGTAFFVVTVSGYPLSPKWYLGGLLVAGLVGVLCHRQPTF